MTSKSILYKAVEQGIISADQAESLFQFIQTHDEELIEDSNKHSNQKPLKHIRSTGDIFISLGIVLLAVVFANFRLNDFFMLIPIVLFIGLAEWLVRSRRMVLPGIFIFLATCFFAYQAILPEQETLSVLGLVTLSLLSLIFYLRYQMPFCLFVLTMSSIAAIVLHFNISLLDSPFILVGFGAIIFCAAFWFDTQDIQRKSYISDNAFWLYFVASPFIVHGTMFGVLTGINAQFTWFNFELFVLVFILLFFALSLIIDRRVILVSTQLYFLYSLFQLFQSEPSTSQNMFLYALVAFALVIIYFGSYWYKTRNALFGFMSKSRFGRVLRPFDLADID